MRAILHSVAVAGLLLAPHAVAPAIAQDAQQPAHVARPPIYDESADAKEQIEQALAKAKKENRRVLIQWGANWCPWCHLLHETMSTNPEIKKELLYEYDVVLVDIGQWDKNLDLAASYGADIKASGVPYLTILDADAKPIANQETGSLEKTVDDKPGHDPAKVMSFLTEHQAEYLSAESVLNDGLAEAKQKKKRVFLHFGAPWCPWCHKLEDWMARKDVAPLLATQFIDVKIDVDRTIGGEKLLERYRKGQGGGIPWFVFLDADDTPIVNSNDPEGNNLGCPWTEEERAAFKTILRKASPDLTDGQINQLIASLAKERERVEGAG